MESQRTEEQNAIAADWGGGCCVASSSTSSSSLYRSCSPLQSDSQPVLVENQAQISLSEEITHTRSYAVLLSLKGSIGSSLKGAYSLEIVQSDA